MSEMIQPVEFSPLRTAVDPLGDLPYVELHPSGEPQMHPQAANYRIEHATGNLGDLTIITADTESYVSRLALNVEPYRKRSLGMAALLLAGESAHKTGVDLRTDPAGEYLGHLMLWQEMVDRGAAVVLKPFMKRPAARWQPVPLVHRGGHIIAPQQLPGTAPIELPPPSER